VFNIDLLIIAVAALAFVLAVATIVNVFKNGS